MDKATLIGIISGFGLILGAILLGSGIGAFIDIPSLLIVGGGTVSVTLVMERMENVIGAGKVASNAFLNRTPGLEESIQTILRLSKLARQEGILALENEKIDDVFLSKGIRMAVDGLAQEEISETMRAELVSMKERHQRGQKVFKFMGASAPSMGMIGTLIGLVQMLQSLSDPSTIGPSMAVALLTTMYGAILAFVICNPIAEKLATRSGEESTRMLIIIEGVEGVVKGHNASLIKERLEARLSPKARTQEGEAA